MVDLRGSVTVERALQALIIATIVTSMLAAGSILRILEEARAARWAFLTALAALAAVYALRRRREVRAGVPHALAAVFLVLALVSTAWSAFPRLTLSRAASLAILFVACAGVTLGAARRLEALQGVARAVLVAAAVVGVAGLLVLAFARDRAVQSAYAQEAMRYQGLGGGPNTAPMLLAVAVPMAAYTVVEARTRLGRATAAAIGLLLLGSIVASGSRGALIAVFTGLGVYAVLVAPDARGRVFALGAVAALALVSVLATRLPQPDPTVVARPGTALPASGITPTDGYFDADLALRLQEDVGRPSDPAPATTERSLLGGSGRTEAWEGGARLGAQRPVAGFGFGTEDKVFVDRYFHHGSNLPENSYVGIFLQLGLVGIALFGALVCALAAPARAVVRRRVHPGARLAAACAGGLAAGLALALTQSYIYSAGSNATAATWLCAFLLPAAAATVHEGNGG